MRRAAVVVTLGFAFLAACGGGNSEHKVVDKAPLSTTTTIAPPPAWCRGLKAYRQLEDDVENGRDNYGTIAFTAQSISEEWHAAFVATTDGNYSAAAADADALYHTTLDFSSIITNEATLVQRMQDAFKKINIDIEGMATC